MKAGAWCLPGASHDEPGRRGVAEADTTQEISQPGSAQTVGFAHESEREFAKILDFYEIRWLYEPRSFPLRWDADGRAIESFTPDFYLLDHDLFIELTTLKQSLVTKKNRKLRLLRELYPDIRIKLFYGRDFKSLMTKYGMKT
jgi:hypoxanthine phosphoribosyltransferase